MAIDTERTQEPSREPYALAIVEKEPWEIRLFKSLMHHDDLEPGQFIDVSALIDAYEQVMIAHGLNPYPRKWLMNAIMGIKTTCGSRLAERTPNGLIIKYQAFSESLVWYMDVRKYYGLTNQLSQFVIPTLKHTRFDWNKNGLIMVTAIFDVLLIMIISFAFSGAPPLIVAARAGAIIILMNMLYMLMPMIGMSRMFPDNILAVGFPAEHGHLYHQIFAYKILAGTVLHVATHIGQMFLAIRDCTMQTDGTRSCEIDEYSVIDPGAEPSVEIDWIFFLKQYAHYTGGALTLVFLILMLALIGRRQRCFRYSSEQVIHKSMAVLGFALTIAHGATHLIGFNFSYLIILPPFLIYCWRRRYHVIPFSVPIVRWVITPSTIRLYLQDDKRLNEMLTRFGNVTLYVNYPQLSRPEWHPFALTRGYDSADAIISMQRVGRWTNNLAELLSSRLEHIEKIRCGHFTRSKFRYHRLYSMRYFFCAGIGITAFMASMIDTIRRPADQSLRTILAWSVSDINVVSEFSEQLMDIQSRIPNVKIKIYYSNNRLRTKDVISSETMDRFDYLQTTMFGSTGVDVTVGTRVPICCRLKRVDFIEILSRGVLTAKRANQKTPIGVFICGPPRYTIPALDSVRLINRNDYGITFRSWSELSG